MKSSVIIKGNKYGFQIVLNPALPFEELLREVAEKFRESIRFFDFSQSIAVSFEGRDLTQGEQNLLVDTIVENSGLRISYIINGGKAVETEFAEALSDVREEEETEEELPGGIEFPENLVGKNGQFYRGTLRSGQKIEVDGSIVVLGDINPGAQIIAGGNVVVLGCLKGTVYAGYPGDRGAFVASLMMEPMQIQIGDCIARSPDQKVKKTKKKKNQKQLEAKLAFVENDSIFIETITRSLISEISIS
ncbi:MAG TPA: septum site-determining protein MinC [Candidatus Anaerobutyricum stercoripullorum]|uniref:Probable septum site-determining protein MinC n=1 Tax=Candidatus Anaerobutyricum stercoripullorum TaxID=2838456 RepID=A0A9D2BDM0_9FIRM|nr:septum site-determining protein MinC [Candidatus Anaerobutyricum stercoripullorum]